MLIRNPVWTRRKFFWRTSMLGVTAAIPGADRLVAAAATRKASETMKVYTDLGLRPIINASGTYTTLGGSLMPKEVVNAMVRAGDHYVVMMDLYKAVGARIAKLTGNDGALVTTGAAGAIFVGTCACIAGDDKEKMSHLPFTDGMKNEVICQTLHKTGWVRQCEAAGARMVVVEERADLEKAFSDKTAMFYFLVADRHFGQYRDQLDAPGGKIPLEECVRIAHAHKVPVLVDAAAELPPHENLSGYSKTFGVDLVAFSGGKGLRGPQNAGLLLGNKSLTDKALMFQSPASGIGRDLKIAKETAIGMLAAVERYVKVDHAAEMAYWKGQIDYIRSVVSRIPGVEAGDVPPWVTNHVPRLWIKWDEKAFNFSREECFKALQEGDPSVVALRTPLGVTIVTWMMAPGEEKIVAQRLKEVLTKARGTASLRPQSTEAELAALRQDNPIDEWDPENDGLVSSYSSGE
jgi:D-glucosaminate-6-phosphate ammonia-lyase